jgi:hypothetical protein
MAELQKRTYQQEWKKKNPEKVREYRRKYYQSHKDEINKKDVEKYHRIHPNARYKADTKQTIFERKARDLERYLEKNPNAKQKGMLGKSFEELAIELLQIRPRTTKDLAYFLNIDENRVLVILERLKLRGYTISKNICAYGIKKNT